MTGVKLGLPTDIPWHRVCVTEDMVDPDVCDEEFPPKWHSSIAVFRYMPPDEFQLFPDYEISYLKLAVTVTGYQPRDKEVEGDIDWDGLNVETIAEVEALLDEYHPCTGAIVQVAVEPSGSGTVAVGDYPFFMDFEPKKRELFEMATDTKERSSRSLETLNVGKSATSLQSTEVLDIDMGGSTSIGVQGSFAGTGGGLDVASSTQGQWGTKTVGQNQSGVVRTTEESQEKREAHSFTTTLSQLYHLLDSYHLGTNRAVFFIQPRPHVLEQPSGFVTGPRPIDGVQEFFLVVAKPKAQKEYCVSVRLDTAHLAEIDIMAYDYKKQSLEVAASASAPARVDDPGAVFDGFSYLNVELFGQKIGERRYRCMSRTSTDSENYIPPADYRIDLADTGGFRITNQSSSNGSVSVTVAPGGSSITATVTARGRRCFNDGGTICLDCPDYIGSSAGYANLSLIVNLRSKEPIKKIGTDQVVIITTRGLCCCPTPAPEVLKPGVIGHRPLRDLLAEYGGPLGVGPGDLIVATTAAAHPEEPSAESAETEEPTGAQPTMTTTPPVTTGLVVPRVANAIAAVVQQELRRVASPAGKGRRTATPYALSDYFAEKLERRLRTHGATRGELEEPIGETLPPAPRKALAKYLSKQEKEITRRDLVGLSADELARVTKMDAKETAKLRLGAFKIVKAPKPKTVKGPGRGGGRSPQRKRESAS